MLFRSSLEDFSLASQLSQSEAMKFFIEMFRSQRGYRRGIIWWNIMDGWPQFSDAVVDYYFTKKLSYGVIKRSQFSVCMMISDADGGLPMLFAVNDTKEECTVDYSVYDAGNGRRLMAKGTAAVPEDSSAALEALQPETEQTLLIIDYKVGGQEYRNHFLYGKPPFDFKWLADIMEKENFIKPEGFDIY